MKIITNNIFKIVDEDGSIILGHGLYLETSGIMKGYQRENNLMSKKIESGIEIDNTDYDTYKYWLTTDDGQTPIGISSLEDLRPYLDQYYVFDIDNTIWNPVKSHITKHNYVIEQDHLINIIKIYEKINRDLEMYDDAIIDLMCNMNKKQLLDYSFFIDRLINKLNKL